MAKNSILEYKGYRTHVEYDAIDGSIGGVIEGINDFVNFVCDDIKSVEREFHAAVDEYLEYCQQTGKEPEKEYKGTFNVRIKPELHKQLALCASQNGASLNSTVEEAIAEYVARNKK